MSHTFEQVWEDVAAALDEAKGIAFDGCHKVYVMLDHEQVHQMAGYGYGSDEGSHLITAASATPAQMLETVKGWYADSCPLRFVQSIETNVEDPNEGFSNLIGQGYEEEFCQYCGEHGADYSGYCWTCQDDFEEEEVEDEEDEDEDEE